MSLDKHKRLLTALHARCDASARFWNTGASNGALRVLVAGGGPVGLRAAIEMALQGHRVTVLEAAEEPGEERRSDIATVPPNWKDCTFVAEVCTRAAVFPCVCSAPASPLNSSNSGHEHSKF